MYFAFWSGFCFYLFLFTKSSSEPFILQWSLLCVLKNLSGKRSKHTKEA